MKAILLDDETDSLHLLELQLRRHCPQITDIHTFSNPVQALHQIPLLNPDVLFTDIEMPELDGFGVLDRLSVLPKAVIFVTAYNQYAIKAFRFNALDYLVKPVEVEELIQAVSRVSVMSQISSVQLSEARKQVSGELSKRLAITSSQGLTFINLADILLAEANNHYSKLILVDGRAYLLSKTMKEVQETLEESHFLRIHRQYIVNLQQVRHFNKNENLITLSDNMEVPLARSMKDKLIQHFKML